MKKGIALGPVLDDATNQRSISNATIAEMKTMGVTTVRFELIIGNRGHGQNNAWDLARLQAYNGVVEALKAQGIEPIGLLAHQIVAQATQANWQGTDADWATFERAYLLQIPVLVDQVGACTHWEIWNEPSVWNNQKWFDHEGALPGATYIDPVRFVSLLEQTHKQIKDLNTATVVIMGAPMAHTIGGASEANSNAPYLSAVLEKIGHGGALPMDAVGLHCYLERGGELQPEVLNSYLGFYTKLTQLPIYITEAGWQSVLPGGVSEAVQATNLTAFYKGTGQHAQLAATCWYSWQDMNGHWGLLNGNGQQKPAGAAFTAV